MSRTDKLKKHLELLKKRYGVKSVEIENPSEGDWVIQVPGA